MSFRNVSFPQRSLDLFLNEIFQIFFYQCDGHLKYAEEY